MNRPIKIFRSFAEAEEAEKEYYRSLTPAQRIQIVLMLRKHYAAEALASGVQKVCRIVKRSDLVTSDKASVDSERGL